MSGSAGDAAGFSAGLRWECRLEREDFTLDASFEGDGVVGLFGPSGAGKSTLLKALCGLIPDADVKLLVGGETIVDTRAGLVPPVHRRRVGLVFQEHRLFPHRSVAANLWYGATRRGAGASARFREVVEMLGLGPLLDRLPGRCSGGEQARVALGRALCAEPRLLLLDEPFASLDRGLRLELLPYLERVARDASIPVVMVSHDLGDLLAVTDELVLLEKGRVLGAGALPELVQDPRRLDFLHDCGLVFQIAGEVASSGSGLVWVTPAGATDGENVSIACGSGVALEPTTPVSIRLRPEDVILAKPPCTAELSLTNQLPGVITHMTRGAARTLVTIDCGFDQPVLAEVTERSVARLSLGIGTGVLAMMKAQALRVRPKT